MLKHLLLMPVFIGLLAACGDAPEMPERRQRSPNAGAGDQVAAEQPSPDVPANTDQTPVEQPAPASEPEKPVENTKPVETTPEEAAKLPAKLPATGPIGTALEAALNGPEIEKHKVYGYEWNIEPAIWSSNGNTVRIEGKLQHRIPWWKGGSDHFVHYELLFVEGKLIKSDYFIQGRGSWISLAAPIVSGVGMAYGIPIPLSAMVVVADKIEKLIEGNWEQAAQKLVLRIGAEAYYRGLRQNLVGP